jgi:hypothetical protein
VREKGRRKRIAMRIKVTLEVEYDADPAHYPDTAKNAREIADVDFTHCGPTEMVSAAASVTLAKAVEVRKRRKAEKDDCK